jgi:hypothetical protein
MQNIIRNIYKSKGIFTCKHPTHEKFDFEVSPYHIFKQKNCFKSGCVEFLWQCRVDTKGKKCPRGYKHVGRNCFSCKYYHEEKICRMPAANIDNESLEQFLKDLDEYEYWLSTVENKRIKFSGQISAVFPSIIKIINDGRTSTRLNGFFIKFDRGHIGYDLFDDSVYLRVGSRFLKNHRPSPGDEIECEAELKNDRGRILLTRPSHVELDRNGGEPVIDYSRALVGKTTGAIVADDSKLCRDCPYGALLDIEVISPREKRYRRFYCLRGVEHAYTCPIRLEKILKNIHQDPISA